MVQRQLVRWLVNHWSPVENTKVDEVNVNRVGLGREIQETPDLNITQPGSFADWVVEILEIQKSENVWIGLVRPPKNITIFPIHFSGKVQRDDSIRHGLGGQFLKRNDISREDFRNLQGAPLRWFRHPELHELG